MMLEDTQPGDEVITTPFTFIAPGETIALMKASPVFIDIDETTFNIDSSKIEVAITDNTNVIMPASLLVNWQIWTKSKPSLRSTI
jgi:UDP-2-acetamido-2-deoxy-ribo-hexuluronate aminotransferase